VSAKTEKSNTVRGGKRQYGRTDNIFSHAEAITPNEDVLVLLEFIVILTYAAAIVQGLEKRSEFVKHPY